MTKLEAQICLIRKEVNKLAAFARSAQNCKRQCNALEKELATVKEKNHKLRSQLQSHRQNMIQRVFEQSKQFEKVSTRDRKIAAMLDHVEKEGKQ